MIPARLRSLPGRLPSRCLVHALCAACLSPFPLGCCHEGSPCVAETELLLPWQAPPPVQSPAPVVRGDETLPKVTPQAPLPEAAPKDSKVLPLGLDTVLALAGE